jgi:hypothetical protein
MPLRQQTYEEAAQVAQETNAGNVPRRDAGAVVLIGEPHDELASVEREGPGGVEILAAVVGREPHPQVGRAVEADQLSHYGPVHGPRAHLRRDLHLQKTQPEKAKRRCVSISIALALTASESEMSGEPTYIILDEVLVRELGEEVVGLDDAARAHGPESRAAAERQPLARHGRANDRAWRRRQR